MKNYWEKIREIDKKLEPEVNAMIKAMEKSFSKYGNIYHYEEFLNN